jgi:hypothetical protein
VGSGLGGSARRCRDEHAAVRTGAREAAAVVVRRDVLVEHSQDATVELVDLVVREMQEEPFEVATDAGPASLSSCWNASTGA